MGRQRHRPKTIDNTAPTDVMISVGARDEISRPQASLSPPEFDHTPEGSGMECWRSMAAIVVSDLCLAELRSRFDQDVWFHFPLAGSS